MFSIGKSYQGRDIWAAKISDNVATDENEPEVLIDALHHAREHLTARAGARDPALADHGLRHRRRRSPASSTRARSSSSSRSTRTACEYDLTGQPVPGLAQEPPAERRLDRRRHRPQPQLRLPLGLLRRLVGHRKSAIDVPRAGRLLGARDAGVPRLRASSRVIDGVQQIRTHDHAPHERRADPVAVRLHEDQRPARHDGPSTTTRSSPWAGRWPRTNGYTAEQSSDLYITDGDQIDWLYATYRIFTLHLRALPHRASRPSWQDHYPDDSKIPAQTARNKGAILHLIGRAGCPYAALSGHDARSDCGPLFDDLEINRGWTRDAAGTDTATWRPVGDHEPVGTSSAGPKQLGTTVSGAEGRSSPAPSPGQARASERRRRRRPRASAAGRSCCRRTPPSSAR